GPESRNVRNAREWLERIEPWIVVHRVSAEQLIAVADFVIHASGHLVNPSAHNGRRYEILRRVVDIGRRIESCDTCPNPVDLSCRNDVVCKCLTCSRISDSDARRLRKVARTLQRCWNKRSARDAFADTSAVIVGKPEGSVFNDRSAG